MGDLFGRLRRAATQHAVRHTLAATAALPAGVLRSAVPALVTLAGSIPILRSKVRENMRLAFGDTPPPNAERRYFQHLGWLASRSLSTFQYGVAATSLPEEITFDESFAVLDEAAAEGRGIVLVSPHWSGHELMGGIVNLRHPMSMIVRQAPTPERMDRKLKWYNALGVGIVQRPSQASAIKDAVAYLKVLKAGRLLAITPDLLAGSGQGVEARLFGRPIRLPGGAFALAMAARAPTIRVSCQWQANTRVLVMFERAPVVIDRNDREAAIRQNVLDWCRWFEGKLRSNPENWLFWLDKRWSQFLRTTSRAAGNE
jgi:lauroyl/myristoyl acyltransferase